MRRMAIALTAAALLVSASISAQAPNFTGKWTLVPAADAPAGGKGGGGGGFGSLCGGECTIAQDPKVLMFNRTTQAGEVKAAYNLDGSESKNTMAGRGGQVTSVSVAKWEGAKLVIVTKTDMGGTMVEAKNVLSLEGGNLVIERTAAGRDGGPPTTTKQTFKKG